VSKNYGQGRATDLPGLLRPWRISFMLTVIPLLFSIAASSQELKASPGGKGVVAKVTSCVLIGCGNRRISADGKQQVSLRHGMQ
jgi:hypothetical protein